MIAKKPERVIELAVKGMLPKNKLGKTMAKKLKVYADAFTHYASGRWSEASRIFASLTDAPARVMQLRCEQLIESSRSDSWDGVWNLDTK